MIIDNTFLSEPFVFPQKQRKAICVTMGWLGMVEVKKTRKLWIVDQNFENRKFWIVDQNFENENRENEKKSV